VDISKAPPHSLILAMTRQGLVVESFQSKFKFDKKYRLANGREEDPHRSHEEV